LFTYYISSLSSATLVASGIRIRARMMMMWVRGMIPGRNQHMPRHGGSSARRVADRGRGRGRRRRTWRQNQRRQKPGTWASVLNAFAVEPLPLPFVFLDTTAFVCVVAARFLLLFYDAQMRGIYNSIIQVDPNMLSFLMRW